MLQNGMFGLTPEDVQKGKCRDEILSRAKVLLNTTEVEVLQQESELICPLSRALDFYARYGRMPGKGIQELLQRHEFNDISHFLL